MGNYYTFKPSINDAAQYQASGKPFLASDSVPGASTIAIEFPTVTKSITINSFPGGISFADGAPQENKLVLKAGHNPFTLEVKCRTLYLTNTHPTNPADYVILAELTGVAEDYVLSGSGIITP